MRRTIVTHSGRFHADDVLATVILTILFGETRVERTRDLKRLEAALGDRDTTVYDVGGVYSPSAGNFDHHMPEGAGTRKNGVSYSSAGLVWKHHGEEALQRFLDDTENDADLTFGDLKVLWSRVDEQLVQGIDALDNGACGGRPSVLVEKTKVWLPSLTGAISSLNPVVLLEDQSAENFERKFSEACQLMRTVLVQQILEAISWVLAKQMVANGADEDPRVLVLTHDIVWQEHLFALKMTDVLYVVFPDAEGTWLVQQVPTEIGAFSGRKPLPESWAGLRSADLAAVIDIPSAVFCHAGRFVGGCGTREDAVLMALLAADA